VAAVAVLGEERLDPFIDGRDRRRVPSASCWTRSRTDQ
jgi:hypothetical protein